MGEKFIIPEYYNEEEAAKKRKDGLEKLAEDKAKTEGEVANRRAEIAKRLLEGSEVNISEIPEVQNARPTERDISEASIPTDSSENIERKYEYQIDERGQIVRTLIPKDKVEGEK